MGRVKQAWLGFIRDHLNPVTLGRARAGSGVFSLIRHVGRRSGRSFEAPVMLADAPGGLVAELTYGPTVNWYRNIRAGGGLALHHGRWYRIDGIEPLDAAAGRRAFGGVRAVVLGLLRRHDFVLLRVEPVDDPGPLPG